MKMKVVKHGLKECNEDIDCWLLCVEYNDSISNY